MVSEQTKTTALQTVLYSKVLNSQTTSIITEVINKPVPASVWNSETVAASPNQGVSDQDETKVLLTNSPSYYSKTFLPFYNKFLNRL